ncbi:MAG: hypothetical protein JNN13_08465 [Planctomycetes bacterium]|nr:hypothetical protein [Planctomycetota bacterium]
MPTIRQLAGLFLLTLPAAAQSPEKPPPWWGVQDDVTVSLHWNFDTGLPGAPDFAVVPAWYNPAVTAWSGLFSLTWMPTLAGHTGVIGLVGNGSSQSRSLSLTVDNDPHLNWIKIFWFQFDAYKTASGDLKRQIEQQLAKYGRAIVSETSRSLGGGWDRVTIQAQLVPQPDDEEIDWTFLESAFGTVAIDDLFVNSRCVKPGPDEDGDAMGKVEGAQVPLTVQVGNPNCQAVAVTEPTQTTTQPTYWIAARGLSASSPQLLYRMNAAGAVIAAPISLPTTSLQAPTGPTDLAVETEALPGGLLHQTVYALVDRRSSGGSVEILAFDADTGTAGPTLQLLGFPPIAPAQFGLAFDASGEIGNGTFWVSDPNPANPRAYEFSRSAATPGLLLDSRVIPSGCVGLGYDETLGNFYGFSSTPRGTPNGVVQVNGFEWSGYDFELTGVEFCGDLTIPNPSGPRGGIARGFEVYRPQQGPTSQLHMVTVVDVNGTQFLRELAGPFAFGHSQLGRCGMAGGPPFLGSTSFAVKLSGVPNSVLALVHLGFSNTSYLGLPLPADLSLAGLAESYLSVSPDVPSPLLTPAAPGTFVLPVAIPNSATLGYAEVFFQWLVLDSQVPGFIALTQAGKTVLYP